MRKSLLLAVTAGLAFSATSVQAASIYSTPANNDVFGATPVEGWLNADLYLVGGPATIRVTLIGYESGYTNSFNFGGAGAEFTTSGSAGTAAAPIGTFHDFAGVSSGLLDFIFSTDLFGSPGSIANGDNALADVPNFFISFGDTLIDGVTPGSGSWVYLALDDGGAGPDDNHDDLVVKLEITSGGGFTTVPEPGVLGLFGLGLVGLGMMRRRKAA